MFDSIAHKLLTLLSRADDTCRVSPSRLLRLTDEVMGEELRRFPDGRMLIWDIARHDGYNIPPYPMAGCGDVKEFLAAEGARNVPGWYEVHLGIDREMYDQIYRYHLVMVRNRSWWRRVFFVPAEVFGPTATFAEMSLWVRRWLEFALGNQSDRDDPALFRR